MTDIIEPPDVNEPYPEPPVSMAEYGRRLDLAIADAPHWCDRLKLEVKRDCLHLGTEASWPYYYAWSCPKLDEHGRVIVDRPAPPIYDRTPECISQACLAELVDWTVEAVDDVPGIEMANGDQWRREGDDLFRLFVKREADDAAIDDAAELALQAAE